MHSWLRRNSLLVAVLRLITSSLTGKHRKHSAPFPANTTSTPPSQQSWRQSYTISVSPHFPSGRISLLPLLPICLHGFATSVFILRSRFRHTSLVEGRCCARYVLHHLAPSRENAENMRYHMPPKQNGRAPSVPTTNQIGTGRRYVNGLIAGPAWTGVAARISRHPYGWLKAICHRAYLASPARPARKVVAFICVCRKFHWVRSWIAMHTTKPPGTLDVTGM
jgi:hypothetical protein